MQQSIESKRKYWENIPNAIDIYRQETDGHNGVLHIHDVFEFLFVMTDGATVTINEEIFSIRKNTLLLFNRTDLHRILVPKGTIYDRYVLYIDAEQMESCSTSRTYLLDCFCRRNNPESCIIPLNDEQASDFYNLLVSMDTVISRKVPLFGDDILSHSLLCQILVNVNRYYREYSNIPNLSSDLIPRTVYRVLQYIYENYTRDLSLLELSEFACVSTHHLCRIFKEIVGVSPMEYIKNLKMTKAKDLLIRGFNVGTTCDKVGYNSLSHFSRQFKKQYGISPQQFAQGNRNK